MYHHVTSVTCEEVRIHLYHTTYMYRTMYLGRYLIPPQYM